MGIIIIMLLHRAATGKKEITYVKSLIEVRSAPHNGSIQFSSHDGCLGLWDGPVEAGE